MFRKLKQKIEQEGSPNAKVKVSESAEKSITNSFNDSTDETQTVSAHKQINFTDDPDATASSVTSNRDDSSGDVTSGADTVITMAPVNSTRSEVAPSTLTKEPTSRRANLAATVLKYGEEISEKNQLISQLEMKISLLLENQTGDATSTASGANLRAKLAACEENELKYKSELERQSVHISELEISLKTLELNGAKYKDKLTDLEVKLAEKHEEVLQLSKQLESSKHMVSTVNSELSSLQAQVVTLQDTLEEKNRFLETMKSRNKSDSSVTSTISASLKGDEMSQLKNKLTRVHSRTKQLEKQLEDKNLELSSLLKENQDIKTNLENNKQKALDDFLSVTQEESSLRSELSSLVQKLALLENQHKTQSRLLAEKQKDMTNLELALDKQKSISRQEKEELSASYSKQITELKRTCDSLTLSLATESQSSAKVKEQLDILREEALDKQLDDEKQLSDLHEQLSTVRGELRQLERSKRKEVDELNNLLSSKESAITKLKDSSLAVAAETKVTEERLNEQIEGLQLEVTRLKTDRENITQSQQEMQRNLETVSAETDELYLRNAELSSQLEKCKIELKSAQATHQQKVVELQEKLQANEVRGSSARQEHETLQEKITLLEDKLSSSEAVQKELDEKVSEIESLKTECSRQEKTISDRNKSLKIHQQTINDLKKTIKRELKGIGDNSKPSHRDSSPSQLLERVRSIPSLTDLERYDSPVEDNAPPPVPTTLRTQTKPADRGLTQQYRHEVNGFCGHKDINFEYLKNVVFSFLMSTDSESLHLVKALAVLLEFTPAEEKLLKDTLEYKMSWWPSTKKPSKKLRK